ncbi:MAG: heavy-metal-associated domain-containing protein [Tannerellaceae bacterium]|jgi:copper chaperone CopZ|nr:heavy-metal-associated domain-containing protein [Tannerellaceae bacterium]
MKRVLLIMMCALFAFSFTYAQDAKEKKDNKKTVTFAVEGMHCENCVKKVEKNIAFEKGVTDLKCDLPAKKAEVTYRTDKTTEDKIAAAFKKIGMEATAVKGENN